MNRLNQFFVFIVLLALNFSACRKFDSTYFEYKAGDEKVECNTFCNPVGYYLSDKDETTIEICTEDDRQAMNIVIPEKTTGEWTNADGAYILYTNDGKTGYEVYNNMKGSKPLYVIITKYGNVGDFIEGTFSAKLSDEFNNIIEISEGRFKVERIINDYY
ncbi:MAG: hypothetical protein K8R54_05595 [Bacteroidales bacterium]|nr:hypothetical protein [Bacteroidales bacterium]